jgi:hypothetical protein
MVGAAEAEAAVMEAQKQYYATLLPSQEAEHLLRGGMVPLKVWGPGPDLAPDWDLVKDWETVMETGLDLEKAQVTGSVKETARERGMGSALEQETEQETGSVLG